MAFDARDVALADLDLDGHLDLIVENYGVNYAETGYLTVHWGVGGGTFGSATSVTMIGAGPGALTIGDIDGDCRPDIAVATPGWTTHGIVYAGGAQLVINRGNRTFAAPLGVVGGPSNKILLGDLDGDAIVEVIVGSTNGTSTVLHGTGNLQFDLPTTLTESELRALVDIDHDGKLDLVAVAGVRLGLGNRTFAPRAVDAIRGEPLGDVDGDGQLDFRESQYVLAFGQSDGTVKRRIAVADPGNWSGDLDGDGHVDLLSSRGEVAPQVCP